MANYDVTGDVRDTLAAWLSAQLLTLLGADRPVQVRAEWPGPNEVLGPRCVTVIAADVPPEVRYWPGTEWEHPVEDAPGSLTGTIQYTYGSFKLPLQIDVWANYPATRNELVAAVDTALHQHPQVTLPGGDGFPRPGRWHELALLAATLPGAVVYYRFAPAQPPSENGNALQEGEYRVTLTGSAFGLLTAQEAVAIMRTLEITLTVGEAPAPPPETFTVEP